MSSSPRGIGVKPPPFINLKTFVGRINWTGNSAFNGHHDSLAKGATQLNRVAPPVDPLKSYVRRTTE